MNQAKVLASAQLYFKHIFVGKWVGRKLFCENGVRKYVIFLDQTGLTGWIDRINANDIWYIARTEERCVFNSIKELEEHFREWVGLNPFWDTKQK